MTTLKFLRSLGERDARAGKSINAFYDAPLAGHHRHNENARAEYEMGYRAAKQEMRKQMRETPGGIVPAWMAVAPDDADERREYFVRLIARLSLVVTEAQMKQAVELALRKFGRNDQD